jgi:hypothetical protein
LFKQLIILKIRYITLALTLKLIFTKSKTSLTFLYKSNNYSLNKHIRQLKPINKVFFLKYFNNLIFNNNLVDFFGLILMFFIFFYFKIKIKHKDLSVFNLNIDNLENNRVIIDNCFIIFINIYSFE